MMKNRTSDRSNSASTRTLHVLKEKAGVYIEEEVLEGS